MVRVNAGAYLHGASLIDFSANIIGVGEGFMGQLARVTLNYADSDTDAPSSLIAKFAATRQDTRDMAADQNLYEREIGFYRDIGEAAGVPVANCYFSEYLAETNHFVLLLEDLAPGEPTDQVVGADRIRPERLSNNLLGYMPSGGIMKVCTTISGPSG